VLKTLLKTVGLLACVAWFNLVSAATMGGINVMSALGHPLKAEISLGELGKTDKASLAAKLASTNEFKAAGIDFPYSLPKLTFQVDTRSNGDLYIKLTSTQPVNEPFVSLLVELSWPSGKLLREFTFLLDPAGFVPEQPKVAEVKPVEPMVPMQEPVPAFIAAPEALPEMKELPVVPAAVPAVPAAPAAAKLEEDKFTAAETVPAEAAPAEASPEEAEMSTAGFIPAEQVLAEPGDVKPAEPVKMEPLPKPEAAMASVLVEKGDTLGGIAGEIKPLDVSLERMLVAIYRANAKKFDGKNMNRIRAGKILRMPEADEIAKVTQKAAVKEIRAQVADWQDYRQKLAAAKTMVAEQAPKQEVAGKISAAVAENAPVIKESAKEVLRLSKGESLGDKAVAGSGAKNKQEMLTANADDAAAKKKQMEEEQKKIAQLETISKDASKLVELKAQPAVPAAPPVAEQKTPEPVAKPVAKGLPPVVAPATQTPEEEFDILGMFNKYLSMLLDDPVMLGAGVAVLLGLGGLGFVMSRRGKGGQKKSIKKKQEVGEATGSWRTPVAPSPDTGDFTQSAAAPAPVAAMSVAAALDDVDPISEADLFLNFGRDAQAEEILKDALKKSPSNIQIKLKLLSIYANRKDSNTFSKYAQEIKDSGDTSAWERASVMGRDLDPSNPTYGDAKGEVRQREPAKAEVDFDLGLGKTESPAISNTVAAQDFKMDFDLSGNQSVASPSPPDLNVKQAKPSGITHAKSSADVDATSILSRDMLQKAQSASPMDFDVSGILPGEVKNATQSSTMDFDISGMLPEESKQTAQSDSMDFDVTGGKYDSAAGLEEPQSGSSPAAETMNFNDLVFEIPTSESTPAKPEAAPQAEASDAMEFTIDFPTDGNLGASGSKPAAGKIDIDFGDININLDEDSPPLHAGGEGKDEQWHEVATKLDLAKAYQEMGDVDGAREILDEVVNDGDAAQRESAEKLLQQIAA